MKSSLPAYNITYYIYNTTYYTYNITYTYVVCGISMTQYVHTKTYTIYNKQNHTHIRIHAQSLTTISKFTVLCWDEFSWTLLISAHIKSYFTDISQVV